MNKKSKIILLNILLVTLCVSVLIVGWQGIRLNSKNEVDLGKYFSNERIDGVVKGSTKMFDTNTYLHDFPLEEYSAVVQIRSEIKDNIRLSVGYKSLSYNLLSLPSTKYEIEARRDCKEIELWSGYNNYPSTSYDLSENNAKEQSNFEGINIEWDLLSIGFTKEEYVIANERIWYLRIQGKDNAIQGYEREETIEFENGTIFTYTEFVPYTNCIEKFELHVNNLVFETQFYPYFDGTSDIIVPIRAVNHELKISNRKSEYSFVDSSKNDATTTPGYILNKDKWAVVFATSKFKHASDLIHPGPEGCGFIIGSQRRDATPTMESWQYLGIIDYGWSAIYCMDEADNADNPLETVTYTYESYFNSMMSDANSKVGSGDELIVLVYGHGGVKDGKHYTLTYNTKYTWDYVIKRDEYRSKMDDITNDGTYVFLHINACNGYGFDGWSSSYHNNRLAIWTYVPLGVPQSSSCNDFDSFCWQYGTNIKATGGLLQDSYSGDHVTNIGETYDYTSLRVDNQNYLGSYQFRLRGDFDVDDFHQFWQQTNEEISSTKSDSQIQFSYSSSMGGDDYALETYILLFAETDDDFYVEILTDWSVYSGNTIWHTLLEIGFYNYQTDSFTREMGIGTRDSWNGNYGYYRCYVGGTWYNTENYGEVGTSKTNVKYIIQRSGTQIITKLVQGTTNLYYRYTVLSTVADINSIRIYYKHHTDYLLGPSSWTIKSIDADIDF
ncbi:MAG: hypothetical protein FK733_14105 [Asgard group archaeon]|nr:hypothetical protein [Asgard group archaeon]